MRRACFLLIASALFLTARAAEVPRPLPDTFVHDFAGVVSDEKKAEINAKARLLKEHYKTEIAVVTVDSLRGEDPLDYSMKLARSWGIGSPEEGSRGLLILVAVKDRKTSFRTSRHTEGELPDGVTGEISREMNGFFKRGDFGGGLSVGMDRVLERMKASFDPAAVKPTLKQAGEEPGAVWMLLALFSFASVIILPLLFLVAVVVLLVVLYRRAAGRRSAAASARAHHGAERYTSTPSDSSSAYSSDNSSAYSPSYDSWSASSSPESSSPESSSSDSGSGYGGSSDFGGGGSDSSW